MIKFQKIEQLQQLDELLERGKGLFLSDGNSNSCQALVDKGRLISQHVVGEQIIYDFEEVKKMAESARDYSYFLGEGVGASCAVKAMSALVDKPAYVLYSDTGNIEALYADALLLDGNRQVSFSPKQVNVFCYKDKIQRESIECTKKGLGSFYCLGVDLFDSLYCSLVEGDIKKSERLWDMTHLWHENMAVIAGLELSKIPAYLYEKLTYYASEGLFSTKSSAKQLSFVISLYKNTNRAYNNYTFVASSVLAVLYQCFLSKEITESLIVPDRYGLLKLLADKCGLALKETLSKVTKRENTFEKEKVILKEYKKELSAILSIKETLYRLYRRLRAADDRHWQEELCSEELILLAILTDELTDQNGLLRHIIQSGVVKKGIMPINNRIKY